jgi:hypothetical protein
VFWSPFFGHRFSVTKEASRSPVRSDGHSD